MTTTSVPGIETVAPTSADTVVGVQGGRVKRFGASPSFAQMSAAGFLLSDTTSAAATGAALSGISLGPAQITTADGNRRGKWFSTLKAAPSAFGNSAGIDTAFNGDLSSVPFAIEHRITGTATLGQPASGFTWVPEACPIYGVIRNASGWNQSNTGNDGRTAMSFLRMKAFHAGRGGTNLMSGTVVLSCADDAANTNFLANGAGCVYTGDYFCTVDGVYMDAFEVQFHDQGHDVAAAGYIKNFERTNATGAKAAWWVGDRVQSIGTQPIDVCWSASGKANIGLDLSFLDHSLGSFTSAAITLKADQRIYFNATASDSSGLSRFPSSAGSAYMTYSSGTSALAFIAGGNSSLQVGSGTVITTVATHLGQGTNLDYVSVQGSAAAAPTISAAGPSTDVDVFLVPKGAGNVRFGTHSAKGAEAFSGFITIKDGAGNARKVMVCA